MRNALLEYGPLSQGRGPLYPRRAAPAVRIARPRQQQEPLQQPLQQPVQAVAPAVAEQPAPAEQDDTGLVGKIADGALTAVGALGNVLDLPGSSVRDILQGKNPFDQWLDPLSHTEKGTSSTGRDLLETYGMRKNKETGWVPLEDPGEFARDAAGFVAELALDPLAWITGGMSGAAKKTAKEAAEKAAEKAATQGLNKAATDLATRSASKKAAQAMGKGFSRAMDAYDKVDPGQVIGRKMYDAGVDGKFVKDMRTKAGDFAGKAFKAMPDQVQEIGRTAAATTGDITGKAVRGFKRGFNRDYEGLREQVTQDAMIDAFDPTMAPKLNETLLPAYKAMDKFLRAKEGSEGFDRLKEFNVLSDRVGDYLSLKNINEGSRRLKEHINNDAEFEEMVEALNPITGLLKELYGKLRAEGIILDELDDTIVNYIPRKLRESVKQWESQNVKSTGASGIPEFSVSDPEYQASRKDLFRDVEQSALDELARNETFGDSLEYLQTLKQTFNETGDVADPSALRAAKAKLAEYVESSLAGRGDPNMRVVKKDKMHFVNSKGEDVAIAVREGRKLSRSANQRIIQVGDDVHTLDPSGNTVASGKITERSGDTDEGYKYTFTDTETGQQTVFDDSPASDSASLPLERLQVTHPSQQTYLHPQTETPIRPKTTKRAPQIVDHYFNHPALHLGDGMGLYEPVLQGIMSGVSAMHGTHKNARFLNKVLTEAAGTGILKQPLPDQRRIETVGTPLKDVLDTPGMKKFDKNKLYLRMAATPEWKAKIKQDRMITADKITVKVDGEDQEFDALEYFLFGKQGVVRDVDAAEQVIVPNRLTKTAKQYFDDLRMDKAIADDIVGVNAMTTASPFKNNPFKSLTTLWKKSVLTHPARYARDTSSGQIQNMTHGIFSGRSAADAGRIVGMPVMGRFKTSDKLKQAPAVVEYMNQRGLDNVDQAVAELYAIHKGHAASIYKEMDVVDDSMSLASFDRMGEAQPGAEGGFKKAFDRARAMDGATWWNPLKLQGVGKETETTNIIWNMGDVVGKMADDFNRLTGFVELLKRGETAADAMAEANRVQLNYDPKSFTPLERQLKAYLPFYSFFSRESAYVANELATNPSGRLGKLIRLQAKGSRRTENEEGDYIPEHVRTQISIPLSKSPDGGTNYFTGFGLMHDDPVEKLMTLAFDPGDGWRKGLSMLNPLPKAILEHATGRSTFQGGPLGGRDLADMDPTIGRILENFELQDPSPSGRANPVFNQRWIEEIAVNSPASRILSNIKTATDDRKSAWQKMLNIGTGYRITTVSPQQSRSALRDLSDSILREAGARKFSTYTPPTDEALLEIEKTDPEAATKLRAIRRNRELVNQERRANIRRNEMQAVQQSIDSGQMPAMTKTQQQRYDRWVKNFGTATSPDQWTQYVYQRKADGTAQRSGIKDWMPKK